MQHIRARLGGHQDRRRSLPIFGRRTGRDRLELLDAFQAVDDARSPAVILFVVDPVDEHVVVLATAAGKRDVRLSVAMGRNRAADFASARQEVHQSGHASIDHRQLHDFGLPDGGSKGGLRGFDERRLTGNGQVFLNAPQTELRIDRQVRAGEQLDALSQKWAEACKLRLDGVGTRGQCGNAVKTFSVGDRLPSRACRGVGDRDRCAWQNRPGLVDNSSVDGGSRLAECPTTRRKQNQNG
jgi:hypothetical protein